MAGRDNRVLKYLNFGLSFGLTMGITLYVLYLGGKWLDKRLGTTPIFICLGVLLAIVTVFKQLLTDIHFLNETPGKYKDTDHGRNNE